MFKKFRFILLVGLLVGISAAVMLFAGCDSGSGSARVTSVLGWVTFFVTLAVIYIVYFLLRFIKLTREQKHYKDIETAIKEWRREYSEKDMEEERRIFEAFDKVRFHPEQ